MAKKAGEAEPPPADPDAERRKRLKSLAFSRKLLSRSPANPITPLQPSKTVLKHQGRDVVKKGQRKNRFLFSFPGLLAPITGGKIGELAKLNTRNPVLYLDFPQGRMKLFGTVVYPKNKYLTMQFSRSSKGVLCEDSFDNMIVFSEAWWIGSKEDNPEEIRLDFPEECNVGNNLDFDFGGGAGAPTTVKPDSSKQAKEPAEHPSTIPESRDDVSDDSDLISEEKITKITVETPVRHSARTAGKSLNYAEHLSGGDSSGSEADETEMVEEVHDKTSGATKSSILDKDEDSALEMSHSNKEYEEGKSPSTGKPKKNHIESPEEKPLGKRGALVQATLSTLFDKVATKSKSIADSSPGLRDFKSKRPQNTKQASKAVKGKILANKKNEAGGKKTGVGSLPKAKQSQVEDDDIEDISSESKESVDTSDEDWTS